MKDQTHCVPSDQSDTEVDEVEAEVETVVDEVELSPVESPNSFPMLSEQWNYPPSPVY